MIASQAAESAPPGQATFDVCGELPSGVTVLEASAGTGKTFTIGALAARYVAGGIPLPNLLVVTFTRMATGELRERVRDRLVTAERGLARAHHGDPPPADDEVLGLLADGTDEQVRLRHRRLVEALADFDAATIATTHGFCQHMLSGLGVTGDVEHDVTFVDDLSDLVDEVVSDLYVRRFHWSEETPPFGCDVARSIAHIAVRNPLAPLEPQAADDKSTPAMRRRLAEAVRAEVERRKRRDKVVTYNDLLTRLADTLRHPERGPTACERLRQRYRVALVDEFQDTDPIQWEIMWRAFGSDPATLVLIGDPKQAVYAFRGADVHAYLDARRTAGRHETLGVNWRSDQGLVDAYDALLAGSRLGHPDIPYRPVRAADANQQPRLFGAPDGTPLRLRVVHRDDGHVRLTPKTGHLSKPSARDHIAADLATDLVGLLASGAQIITRHVDGTERSRERLRPGHVAVLVRTHRQAGLVRDALDTAGVPAVINGAGSVFATRVARDWLALLEALERPSSPTRARAAALTPFLGWATEQVATADDDALETLHAKLHRWAGVLARRGVAALVETITLAERLPGRLLAAEDGERALTDLRHIGQLLHAEATASQLGVTALINWLRQRIAHADEDAGAEERSRRLESDAEAVQVLTIHRSKGLEFPVVYLPFLWEPAWIPDHDPPVFHDPDNGDRRTLNVGGEGPQFDEHRVRHVDEQRGEELRLAYVALTRARHQAVVWWASSHDSADSSLGRLLFARDADGTVATHGAAVPTDEEVAARGRQLAADAPGCVGVERATGGGDARWQPEPEAAPGLDRCRFTRSLDPQWRRTSYTALTADAHEPSVGSEPGETAVADEVELAQPDVAGDAGDADRLRAVGSPLAAVPGGAAVGSLVHAVLEQVDFAAPNLDEELAEQLARQRARHHVHLGDPDVVTAGLRAAIDTPLGPLVDDRRLRDVSRADRVDEPAFELPLVGGDRPVGTLALEAIAEQLRAHLPADDPLAGHADDLAAPALRRDLRGYLSGRIDMVWRHRTGNGTTRFVVVDHKTNRLAPDGHTLTAWHYRPAALAQAMRRAHYPLQAVLYVVALHRYLRWRLPGYDPAVHLGGVLYLFVRGMTGPQAPRVDGQPCGVFAWAPPAPLVTSLSDLLDRGGPT